MKRNSFAFYCRRHLALTVLILFTMALQACTSFDRSAESGYRYRGEEHNIGRDRKAEERENSLAELGLKSKKNLSDDDEIAISMRQLLRQAEHKIESRREREQYFKNKPYMRNDRERLEFLSLGSFEAQQRWLNAKGLDSGNIQHPTDVQALIDTNDISIGMTKKAVRDSWGEPEHVDVAGNPIYGNEKWHYTEQVSSAEGYQTQHRTVVFESGRVVGWESR